MLLTSKHLIIGNAPAVKLRTASGAEQILINGPSVFIGPSGVTPLTGFRLDSTLTPINLKNGDELWACATSTAILTLLIET